MNEPKTIRHYELLSRLGEGGMGVVYKARDTRLGRTVALKMLPPELAADEERAHRFEREARIASAISHPGIATLYDFDRDGDVAFLTMELVDGPTLRELLARGPLSTEQLLECGAQVAEALAAAHKAGVIHRDLKPENIMSAESGYYKVLDFGVARLDDVLPHDGAGSTQTPTRTWATKAGTLIGTVAYMSPEQVLGEPIDGRSDIFSFGSVLYELATGRAAFQRSREISTGHAVIYEEPVPLREVNPRLPEGLELVVSKCLAKKAEERYASAEELAEDLRTLGRDSLSGSRGLTRLRAYSPRRRGWILGAVLALTLAAALAWFGWRLAGNVPQAERPLAPLLSESVSQESPVVTSARPRVIVAFFENNSGDPEVDWVSRGLPEMLTTDLARCNEIDVIATQRLYDLLSATGEKQRPELDRSTTAELARWAGANIVIGGSVFKSGPLYRIDAQAYDIATGTVAVAHKVEGRELFRMAGELTAGLLKGLQVSAAQETLPPTVVTSSEEAFQHYLTGKELYDGLRFDEANGHFERALQLDPDFSLARLHLALSQSGDGHTETALPLIERVAQDSDDLPQAERLLAGALEALYVQGDVATGATLFEELARRYPQHKEAYVWWGRAVADLEADPLRATGKLREALEQDPNNLLAVAALARELARLGADEDARKLLRSALERNPEAALGLTRLIESLDHAGP